MVSMIFFVYQNIKGLGPRLLSSNLDKMLNLDDLGDVGRLDFLLQWLHTSNLLYNGTENIF